MPAEIINDVPKLNEQLSWFKDIPVVSNFTQPQCLDNYYQIEMEVTRLIIEEVKSLKAEIN